MASDKNLVAFEREVNQADREINLARAALMLSAFEYPDLEIDPYLAQIDALATEAKIAIHGKDTPPMALAEFLFNEMGFTGNTHDYADPRNSFLHQVLERRLGIPITLSVVYLEVAQRLGLHAHGVGLPGHFIVRVDASAAGLSQVIYLDPFHKGQQLSEEDCRARVRQITDAKLPFERAFLNPVSKRYILTRMLNNLKSCYGARQDLPKASQVIERLLMLNPQDSAELRNLGLLYANTGRRRKAVETLQGYLQLAPNAADHRDIQQLIHKLIADLARLN